MRVLVFGAWRGEVTGEFYIVSSFRTCMDKSRMRSWGRECSTNGEKAATYEILMEVEWKGTARNT
jgi:hypothetical protein